MLQKSVHIAAYTDFSQKNHYVPYTHNLDITRSKKTNVFFEKEKTQETRFSRSEKKYKAIHLGPSTKGPQNLFITVLASINAPTRRRMENSGSVY